MWFTRRKNFSVLSRSSSRFSYERLSASSRPSSPRSSSGSDLLSAAPGLITNPLSEGAAHPPKRRLVLGLWTVTTPNSSDFARHIHSRILQKFPFLVEMFYWAITYFFYRMTAVLSRAWYGGTTGLWDVAQGHGVDLLEAEALLIGTNGVAGTRRWVEWRIQQWFLAGAADDDWRAAWLTVLNRCYALIHIPGTVGYVFFPPSLPLRRVVSWPGDGRYPWA